MNALPCFLRADGCLVFGRAIVEPWPSLKSISTDPDIVLDEILWMGSDHPAWPFVAKVPYPLLSLVREVGGASWSLLELVAAEPERGQDILFHCPALAVLITEAVLTDSGERLPALRSIVRRRWCEILREIGLPPTKRVIRILRKLSYGPCNRWAAVTLARAIRWRHPHVRLLSHLPSITRDTIALLERPMEECNAHLFLASATSGGPDFTECPVTECVSLVSAHLRREDPTVRWPYGRLNYECLQRIQMLFLRWRADATSSSRPFPPPFFPGIAGRITPLGDGVSVMREGDEQNNCAASYIPEIETGECYLYAVTVLERATLALRRLETGVVIVEGLQAASNQDVSRETESFVESWLAVHSALSVGDQTQATP